MNVSTGTEKNIVLSIDRSKDHETICKISRAMSLPERLKILKALLHGAKTPYELSKQLGIPFSSIARHINVLMDAGLIFVDFRPGLKGHAKYCSHLLMNYSVNFNVKHKQSDRESYTIEMPIGMFSEADIIPPCGMAGKLSHIGDVDDPDVFFMPERAMAECIWFKEGYITYNFPVDLVKKHDCTEIAFSFEICSETVWHNNNWPSDITVFINDVEIATFTSPGDFGGQRGKYTPAYWPITSTQFGILKVVMVDKNGVYVDNSPVTEKITFNDLHLTDRSSIKLTIGVKDDAEHRGGMNLFGRNFGNYQQAIIMTLK